MLIVGCFKWGKKYTSDYVNRLARGVRRNLSLPHRFVVITDDEVGFEKEIDEIWPIGDPKLLRVRDGCYVRLRIFDPEWQAQYGVDRFVSLDLDSVITGDLDPLFDRPEPFCILHGGHFNPCPFNGSVQMISAGAHPEVWNDFNIERALKIADADGTNRGTDQTWIAHKVPNAAGWTHADGIYAYGKPGWPEGNNLPMDARIVTFPGRRDPRQFGGLPWVARSWR